MNTHETYVSLEVAKLLKEAGFDWKCIRYYQNDDETLYGPLVEQYKLVETNFNVAPVYMNQYSAPTLDVAQRWLREVKNIQIIASPLSGSKKWTPLIAKDFWLLHEGISGIALTPENFDTYELALEVGIKKALELILEKGE